MKILFDIDDLACKNIPKPRKMSVPNSQVSQRSSGSTKELLKLPPATEQPHSMLARGINCSFSKEQ